MRECGFLTWKKNIGVKMPVLPPLTSALAPALRKSDTAVEPLGAMRSVSSTRTSWLVSARPTVVRLKVCSDSENGCDSASSQGVSGSDVGARSRALEHLEAGLPERVDDVGLVPDVGERVALLDALLDGAVLGVVGSYFLVRHHS